MSKTKEIAPNPFYYKDSKIVLQDEIARTYLKVTDKKKAKSRYGTRIPWLVALAAFILALLVVMSKSNIDIRVRVLSEVPSVDIGASIQDRFISVKEKAIFFIRDGAINGQIIRDYYFDGDASQSSSVDRDQIILRNSRGSGWANFTIDLKEPVNLKRLDIKYTAKGATGDEHLVLVLVDSSNRTYRMEKDLSTRLSDDWQQYTVNFNTVKNAIDTANISVIKFEFGNLTTGNHSTSNIFLKDVYVTKGKRLIWL